MFFLGPDGELLDHETAEPPRTIAEVVRSWRAALDDERQHEGYQRIRPGTRQVHSTGKIGRPGFRDEILVTLRSGPVDAVTVALEDDMFDPPILRLSVDTATLAVDRYELHWKARLRVSPWQRRDVQLRLYASPSLNVSVLSLVPPEQRSAAKSGFLRIGLRAMNQLKDRIDGRVDQQIDEMTRDQQ